MKRVIDTFRGKCRASVALPGSKSVTNRAMVLAALAGGSTRLEGALFSRDTKIMADCLQKLGCAVVLCEAEGYVEIRSGGVEKFARSADFFVGNAGTAARFVTALSALVPGGEYSFDCDAAMRLRPMSGLLNALKLQGAKFDFFGEDGFFPFSMRSCGLRGGDIEVDASASSQILSALLMAAPFAESPARVVLGGETVSRPFVGMTLGQMGQFGFSAREARSGVFEVGKAQCADSGAARVYEIEPDATAASYFAMLPALTGGAVLLERFGRCVLQGDAKFVKLLECAGLVKTCKVGDSLLVESARAEPPFPPELTSSEYDFNDISDTFLTFAASSALFPSSVEIRGIGHTRAQETDRVAAVAAQLAKIVARVDEKSDSIGVFPMERRALRDALSGGRVEISTYDDHRMAMAFSIPGCVPVSEGAWIEIENPGCVSKTWPGFFEVLDRARADSEKFRVVAVDGGAAVGKSTVSRVCSQKLGYMHVDTGAHYRTLSFGLLESGISPDDISAIEEMLSRIQIGTLVDGQSAKMTVNGVLARDDQIRNKRVNEAVAKFAAVPQVRNFLKNYQRSMPSVAAENGFSGLIMEGRDIGSVIFPDANARIFLDADEATRQARRAREGISDSISKRDALDKSRKSAPLVCAEGAERIDTTNMDKDEVAAKTLSIILKS